MVPKVEDPKSEWKKLDSFKEFTLMDEANIQEISTKDSSSRTNIDALDSLKQTNPVFKGFDMPMESHNSSQMIECTTPRIASFLIDYDPNKYNLINSNSRRNSTVELKSRSLLMQDSVNILNLNDFTFSRVGLPAKPQKRLDLNVIKTSMVKKPNTIENGVIPIFNAKAGKKK